MKLFWTVILSVMVGLGPAVPQLAYAEPLLSSKTVQDRAPKKSSNDNVEVLNLGTKEKPIRLLLVDVDEKKTVKKTLKGVQESIEDSVHAFPDLRFVAVTIHPVDDEDTPEDESQNDATTHMFWDTDGHEIVANEIGVSKHRLHSFEEYESHYSILPEGSKTKEVYEYMEGRQIEGRQSELGEPATFIQRLHTRDVNEIEIHRPNTDFTTSLIRGGASFAGVAFGLDVIGDPVLTQTVAVAALPTAAAFGAGLKNKALAAWEESGKWTKSVYSKFKSKKNKKKKKDIERWKQIEGIVKNTGLALGFTALLYVPMAAFGFMDDVTTVGAFLGKLGVATANNVAKKTLFVRALTRWKHKKYAANPRNAAKYSRFHAWMMAASGALITATDAFQLTLDLDNPVYWAVTGSMLLGGALTYKFTGQIERTYKRLATKCDNLFRSKEVIE